MPQTPNHGYNVPNEGEQDWHEPLNENFEQYDTDIEIRDEDANRGNYDPEAGAKFLATDTETVYVGDGSSWTPLESSGRSPTLSGLRVGQAERGVAGFRSPGEEYAVFAESSQENSLGSAIYGENDGTTGDAIQAVSSNDGRSAIAAFARDGTDYGVMSNGDVKVTGDLDVSGNKNFTQTVATPDGDREVVYTATEAGTPHTEASGVAELEDGRAEIALPDHFAWVTSTEAPLHVQTTPYSADSGGLAVVERSTEHVVVEDLDGEGDYEFSYTVKGTREGREDKEVVREPSATAEMDGAVAPADD